MQKVMRCERRRRMMLKKKPKLSFSRVSYVLVAGLTNDSSKWSICLNASVGWQCFSLTCSAMHLRDTTQFLMSSGDSTEAGAVIAPYATSSATASKNFLAVCIL